MFMLMAFTLYIHTYIDRMHHFVASRDFRCVWCCTFLFDNRTIFARSISKQQPEVWGRIFSGAMLRKCMLLPGCRVCACNGQFFLFVQICTPSWRPLTYSFSTTDCWSISLDFELNCMAMASLRPYSRISACWSKQTYQTILINGYHSI